MTFIDPEESIEECVRTLLANGMIPKSMPFGSLNWRLVAVFAVIVILIAILIRYIL
jgi:hypothetical protein